MRVKGVDKVDWIKPPFEPVWYRMPTGRYYGPHWRLVVLRDGEVVWSMTAKTDRTLRSMWMEVEPRFERQVPDLSGPFLPRDFAPPA